MKPHKADTRHWAGVFGVVFPGGHEGFWVPTERTVHTVVAVEDPDGWNRKDFYNSTSERITAWEFLRRLALSTVTTYEGNKGLQ